MRAKNISYKVIFLSILISIVACSREDEAIDSTVANEQTVIMFFPWSSNLLPYFQQNIKDFSESIEKRGLYTERVIVCLATTPEEAMLMELKYGKGKCITDTLKYYNNTDFTSKSNITNLINDIVSIAPGKRYGLIVGCHGMGWLPVIKTKSGKMSTTFHYDIQTGPITRYFGGLSSEYQIETTTLADAISDSGITMEYILFDDCYMSSVEVAYDLKEVTNFLIASPTEVLMYGFPYQKCGKYLLGEVNYEAIIDEFYNFYSTYQYPYGTAAVTNCQELDDLAELVRKIYGNSETFDNNLEIQAMDGYSPTVFYDLKDFINKICQNQELKDKFFAQLEKTIPYKCHTDQYITALKGALPIMEYSGITTSEPSYNSLTNSKKNTNWYKATH